MNRRFDHFAVIIWVIHPKNYQELVKQLPTQEACLDYIASIRWRDGFVCAECGCQQF
jgi:hypothetical protein